MNSLKKWTKAQLKSWLDIHRREYHRLGTEIDRVMRTMRRIKTDRGGIETRVSKGHEEAMKRDPEKQIVEFSEIYDCLEFGLNSLRSQKQKTWYLIRDHKIELGYIEGDCHAEKS